MKNIIIITLDGLRSDKLNLCNNLSNFKKKSIFFNNMIVSAPYTLASLHSIYSGLYPSKNGVNAYYNMFRFKKDKCKTITQYLKEKDYFCVVDVIDNCIIPSQGFDEIKINDHKLEIFERHKKIIVDSVKKEPFFVHLQYGSMHDMMVKEVVKKYDDFSKEYFGNVKANATRYNSYVSECNEYVGKMNSLFDELNLFENTLIIYHADHGTSNGEKVGEKAYGSFTYDYTIKSFCYLYAPLMDNSVISIQCRMIDIMPTILDLLGIDEDKKFELLQGKSLLPIINGEEKEERVAFCETGGLGGPWPSPTKHNVFCIRYKNKKIIYNKGPDTWEFYDLEKDPQEEENIFNKNNSLIKEYKLILGRLMRFNGIT